MAPGRNSSRLLAPGPPRPTATNKVQSLGPVTATGGGDCFFFFLKKKKRQKGYSLLQAQSFKFQDVKKKICPGSGDCTSEASLTRHMWPRGRSTAALWPSEQAHHPPPASNAHPDPAPLRCCRHCRRRCCSGKLTPGRLHRDTGDPEGEGHEIQPGGLKLLREPRGGE